MVPSSKIRFIYTDDDVDDQVFLAEACKLSKIDFEIKQFLSGIELIKYLSSVSPDAFDFIVIDINMPVMDGITAAHLIRKQLKLTCPLYVLSTSKDPKDRERAKEAGVTGYYVKPFVLAELRVLIESMVSTSVVKDRSE